MIFNLQPVIALLATLHQGGHGTYTFTAGPTYTNVGGRMVASAPGASFDATANVQPAPSKRVQQLAEGARAEDWRSVVVATLEVITPTEAAQTDGPQPRRGHTVVIDGVTYEVREAEDWRTTGGFWKLLVQKVAL